jgi:Tol biopolymer transport system component
MHRLRLLVLAAVALGALAATQGQDRPDLQLKAAVYKETVEGDLNGAIALYKQIVSNAAAPRQAVAAALLGLGGCYERLGDAQAREARKAYERLVADYSDQSQQAAEARARLASLKAAPGGTSSLPALRLAFRLSDSTAITQASVSPDGRRLAYVDWDTGNLAVRDLQSGQSHMVTSKARDWGYDDSFAGSPVWAPDGKRLAYWWYRDDGYLYELRIADVSGKNIRVLNSQPESKGPGLTPVGWFPDGTALLATVSSPGRATEIVRVASEGGVISSIRKLGSSWSNRVCLSPDGKYIAFDEVTDPDSLNMDVFVMPSSGGQAAPILTGPYDDRLLDWAPDGRRILVSSNRSGTYDAWLVQIGDGTAVGLPQLLRKELGLVAPIGFSPDGVFYFAPDLTTRDVMVADWSPESRKAISTLRLATEHFSGSTRLPAWSPDGRKLAYLVDRGRSRPAETRVRIRDVETGAERTLADVSGSVYFLSWSPDGTSLAMTVARPRTPSKVEILDVTSGKLIREFASPRSGESMGAYVWGPGGDVVYYVTRGALGEQTVLWRRDLRTGDEAAIHTRAFPNRIPFAVAPDGKLLAIGYNRKLMVIPASGGEPRELVSEAPGVESGMPAWSPDGKHVYFGGQSGGSLRLYSIALTGGTPEDLDLEIGEELRFRPDGRQLAFTRSQGENRREIWVMENVLPPSEPVKK